MDTPNILLHHTKAHLKPRSTGAPFPMHQDYGYFPFRNDSMVAAFIHMDDSDPENGGLAVFPGSHKMGPLEDKGEEDDTKGIQVNPGLTELHKLLKLKKNVFSVVSNSKRRYCSFWLRLGL